MLVRTSLHLPARPFRLLLARLGPSLGLWRAAEVAALREVDYLRPILDVGCGDGLVTSLVVRRADIGVDPWREALERAARAGLYERVYAAPMQRARIPPGSVGSVISNSVLEHLAPVDAVLRTIGRVLRPGGVLAFTVPTPAFSRFLALPFARYAAWRNRTYGHLNLWSVDEWRYHLRLAGLELESTRPYLRRRLVAAWDLLELMQGVWVGGRRLAGVACRHLPRRALDRLGRWAAGLDLSAPPPGGGCLLVARRPA